MALQTIQVADKPTLDLVNTNIQAVKDSISTQETKIDGITAAKHAIWLNDYKTYGEGSFVYKDKDILNELLLSEIAINDDRTYQEALSYAESIGKIGLVLSKLYGYDFSYIRNITTFEEMFSTKSNIQPLMNLINENKRAEYDFLKKLASFKTALNNKLSTLTVKKIRIR